MNNEQDHEARCFEPTHWSLVARAGDGAGVAQRQALGDLVRRYLPALRSHLTVRKRIQPHDAEDLLQEFLTTKVVQQGLVGEARRERGRFRTFLLTALDNFVVDRMRCGRAKKRRPGEFVAVDEELDAAHESLTADVFDVAWAQKLLADALRRMRQDCESTDRADIWGVFEARVLEPMLEQAEPWPYQQLVARYGFTSPTQACNVLITGKRMFVRAMRSIIGEYEFDESAIDAEIADLHRILSQPKAR